jgi:hypothetical protein
VWRYVIPHFEGFLAELDLSVAERSDAAAKADRVARSLFAKYYPDQTFNPSCYMKAGSFGKGTAVKPRTDIDLIFALPRADFFRINVLAGNKQSQLLQEVKRTLVITFPTTDIRGNGPVVEVPFGTYNFDVVPAFLCDDGKYLTAHTRDTGSWKYSNPVAEFKWLQSVDTTGLGKATHLVKMLKAWKGECNVPVRSICIETLAILFVDQWINKHETLFYYDWMVRDFFAYMLRFAVDGKVRPAGIADWIELGDGWQSKCQTAYARALKACDYERDDFGPMASFEWQKIFGSQFTVNYGECLLNLQSLMLAGT